MPRTRTAILLRSIAAGEGHVRQEDDMSEFKAKKMTRRFTQQFVGTPERVFPLLCPTREYEWIEPWERKGRVSNLE